MIYHIAHRSAWEMAREDGAYRPPSLASEGFIHCSAREQVLAVVNEFYRGQADLLLLCIDESKLTSALRWEAPAHPSPASVKGSRSEAQFPHVYGALNLDAVVGVFDLHAADNGFAMPSDLP